MGRRVENIKATKKVSWCKTRTQKGRGKMAAEVQSWSQQFECLNVLGFQRPLARMCGLSIRPDCFCCLPVLKTGVAKWPPKCRKFVTVFCVPKCARISTTFGKHLWTGDMPWSFLLFARPQNGWGKMAAKRRVSNSPKVVKFVVGK